MTLLSDHNNIIFDNLFNVIKDQCFIKNPTIMFVRLSTTTKYLGYVVDHQWKLFDENHQEIILEPPRIKYHDPKIQYIEDLKYLFFELLNRTVNYLGCIMIQTKKKIEEEWVTIYVETIDKIVYIDTKKSTKFDDHFITTKYLGVADDDDKIKTGIAITNMINFYQILNITSISDRYHYFCQDTMIRGRMTKLVARCDELRLNVYVLKSSKRCSGRDGYVSGGLTVLFLDENENDKIYARLCVFPPFIYLWINGNGWVHNHEDNCIPEFDEKNLDSFRICINALVDQLVVRYYGIFS